MELGGETCREKGNYLLKGGIQTVFIKLKVDSRTRVYVELRFSTNLDDFLLKKRVLR